MRNVLGLAVCTVAIAISACSGGGSPSAPAAAPATAAASSTVTPSPGVRTSASPTASPTPTATPTARATPTATPTPTAAPSPAVLTALPLALNVNNLPGSFYGEIVAQFTGVSPRNMVMLPNGDLLIGTGGGTANFAQSGRIYIIQNADGTPSTASVFATLTDIACSKSAGTNTNGVTFAPAGNGGSIFVGMECSVWKIPYTTGDRVASSLGTRYVSVRTGAPPVNSDGDVHHTTSLLAAGNTLYVGVGSSCNACTETDPTRGTVLKTDVVTPSLTLVATRLRNALALAVNPATGTVWAGGAGQDCVVGASCFAAMDDVYGLNGHPYEWMDPLTKHAAPVDYMWPWCEENKSVVTTPDSTAGSPPAGTNCNAMIVAPVRAPAYSTIIAATFYAPPANAAYAFPSFFRGGMFMTLHGSWHENTSGIPVAVPQVVFVPIASGDTPAYPMDWANGGSPYATWARNGDGNPSAFMNGFQQTGTRIGRPAGLAVGSNGSLFISDDSAGAIYRIRPGIAPASFRRR